VFMLWVFEIDQYERLAHELYENKIRLDTEPASVSINKTHKGGVQVTLSDDVSMDEQTITDVLREHGYVNAEVTVRGDISIDELIDAIMDNRVYLPSIVAVNKADLIDQDYLPTVKDDLREHDIDPEEAIFISAEEELGLDGLKKRIWEELGLIRVYMDKPGRGVDYEEPLVLPPGSTVEDACLDIGGDEFLDRFRFARVRGASAKHDDQQVGMDHELADEDELRIIVRK